MKNAVHMGSRTGMFTGEDESKSYECHQKVNLWYGRSLSQKGVRIESCITRSLVANDLACCGRKGKGQPPFQKGFVCFCVQGDASLLSLSVAHLSGM